jgi:ATP-dependent 26S proteasome regulatory subunit
MFICVLCILRTHNSRLISNFTHCIENKAIINFTINQYATSRLHCSYDSQSGGEKEIQRTMLELLNQLDGFDARGEVKVIMATNRIETLDPALLRPGRIDRKIEFPLPSISTKRRIFNIHTNKMTKTADVDLEEFIMSKEELSGADIKAICTEAGMLALRERRMKVCQVGSIQTRYALASDNQKDP